VGAPDCGPRSDRGQEYPADTLQTRCLLRAVEHVNDRKRSAATDEYGEQNQPRVMLDSNTQRDVDH
jgi:hypothetical protein